MELHNNIKSEVAINDMTRQCAEQLSVNKYYKKTTRELCWTFNMN